MSEHTLEKRKRVFVFGNGVSQVFGVPLTNRLLSSWVGGCTACPNLLSAVKYLYPAFDPVYVMFPGVEDLMGKLYTGIDLFRMIEGKPAIRRQTLAFAKREIHKLLLTRLWRVSSESQIRESALLEFLRQIQPGESIITLNWDTLVERCLSHLRQPWVYYRDDTKITVLKLHGSINWFSNRSVLPDIRRIDPHLYAFYAHMDFTKPPQFSFRAIDSCILVPPTPIKTINQAGLMRIWNDAYRILRHAQLICCAGYSMPENDDMVRLLLRRAFRFNVNRKSNDIELRVLNPDTAVDERFRSLGGRW